MRLLLTRPEADAARTRELLAARGHDVLVAPVLRIEPLAPPLGSGPFDAVLLTSANAAHAIAAHPRRADLLRLPVLAAGRRTAASAREAGFTDVDSADGDAVALARLAAARLAAGARVLHAAGRDRAADLTAALAACGIKVEIVVVYRALAASSLERGARAALAAGGLDAVLHYSPRSAAAFLACAERAGCGAAALALTHCCLSAAVAAPLRAAGAARIRVAARPDEPALLDTLDDPAE